jgi:predicted HTH domain antitoxin
MGKVKAREYSEYEQRLLKAIEAIQSDKSVSLRAASRRYGVSRTTLTNRVQKNTKPKTKAHSSQQRLTVEEEDELQR